MDCIKQETERVAKFVVHFLFYKYIKTKPKIKNIEIVIFCTNQSVDFYYLNIFSL